MAKQSKEKVFLEQVEVECMKEIDRLEKSTTSLHRQKPGNALASEPAGEYDSGLKSCKDVALRQLEVNRARLVKIRIAIKLCGDGEYGQCLKCTDEISARRLKANPEALLCVDCLNELERARSQGRAGALPTGSSDLEIAFYNSL